MHKASVRELKRIYPLIKDSIQSRLKEFSRLWKKGTEEDIFSELAFCILTPQSRAKTCWKCVERFRSGDLLLKGKIKDISKMLARAGVRFHNNKARYIVEAREFFKMDRKVSIKPRLKSIGDVSAVRDWLARNVMGLGYKEASHFLRNTGSGDDLAILDRHILKNLVSAEVIKKIPKNLSRPVYLEIEKKMKEFAGCIGIPMSHLDFLMWYKETGIIFK